MSASRRSIAHPFAAALAVMAIGALLVPTAVRAQPAKAVAGTLTCKGEGSVGMILGSKQELGCSYKPVGGGPSQRYRATITKIGLDIGATGPTTLVWTVLGSTTAFEEGALVGQYGGLSAEASVGIGGGANALVGGSSQSVVLQPLSVQGQTGVNLAVGVAELTIR